MKKLFLSILLSMIMGSVNAQPLTGIKNIPSDYLTIQAAIADLNTNGTGPGGVIFNVDANHTETLAGSSSGIITATGTAGDTIVFRKNPATTGNNPRIMSFLITVTASTDGIIKIAGGDYITFDGIDLEENPSNISTTKMTEWGYALVKKQNTSPFDGCQHVMIKNCTITLNKANVNSVGIYSGNHITTATTALTITATSDASNNCRFDNNTISNVYTGIKLNGYNAPSPYTLYDHHNAVGEMGKNRIFEFGGANQAAYGIYATNQDSIKVMNDSIAGGAGSTNRVAGILLQAGISSSVEISGNYISLSSNAIGGNNLYGIWNLMGSTPSLNAIKIHDNNIKNCNYITATTGTMYGILNSAGADTVRIYNNEIVGSTFSGTNTHYGIRSDGSGTIQIISNNIIHDLTNTSTGGLTLIYTGSFPTATFSSNNIYDCTGNGGTVYGMYATTTATWNVYRNSINNLSSNTGSAATTLVYGIYNQGSVTANIYNNFIAGLQANAATVDPSIVGIDIVGGTASNVFFNTVYLNASSSGTSFGTADVYSFTGPVTALRNNILVNTSTPGATGHTVAYRRKDATISTYSSSSDNNCFFSGTPGPDHLIFYNGIVGDETIEAFKTRVAPRDASSFSEDPPFIEGTTPPYNVHLSTSDPTFCESGGHTVTSPAIINDFDDDPRFPNAGYPDHPTYPATAPDVGADEFGGIHNDLIPPVFSYIPLANTSSLSARTLIAGISDVQSGVPTTLPGLPVVYWKINNAPGWNSSVGSFTGGDQYSFSFGTGAIPGDVVYYYICAQDGFLVPNVGVSPVTGADGFSADPPFCSTPPSPPNAYRIVGTLPAGDYLIGGTGTTPSTGCTYVDITQAFADINNVVDRIEVTNGGGGYSSYSTTVIIYGGGGAGALAEPVIDDVAGTVTAINVTRNGDGYYLAPEVEIISGTGTGAAATAYIGAGKEITGPVNFIIDTSYQWTEENYFPLHLEPVIGVSATNTITLKPGPLSSPVIYGNYGSSIIKLNGVDYFTLDGSNNGSSSKDLILSYLASGVNSAAIWISSASETDGATYNTIKNCQIKGSGPGTLTYAGIFSGGPVSIENNYFALAQNSHNRFENNSIYWARNGIVALGKSTNEPDEGLMIINNQLGTDMAGEGFTNQGIFIENQDTGFISGNHIQNVIYDNQFFWVAGIYISNSKRMSISANKIHNLRQSTPGASYWVDGIYQSCPAFNTMLDPSVNNYSNNVIYDLTSNGESAQYNVIGIHNAKGWGDKYHYNSVYLSGQLNQSGSSNGSMSACFSNGKGVNSTNAQNIEVKNNIFYINSYNPSGINHHYGHYTTLNSYAGSALDYNLLFHSVSGTAIGHVGYFNGINQDDIIQWRIATLQDYSSLSADPLFNTAFNLTPFPGSPVLGAGIPVPGITTDYTGAPRDVLHPSIGAYENFAIYGRTWNGSVSTDWNNGSNWTPSGIPQATEDLIIPSATPFMCILNSTGMECKNIVINTGAIFTMANGSGMTVFGNFTIQDGGTLVNDGVLTMKGDLMNWNTTK